MTFLSTDGPLEMQPRVEPRNDLLRELKQEQQAVVEVAQFLGALALTRLFGRLGRRRVIVRGGRGASGLVGEMLRSYPL